MGTLRISATQSLEIVRSDADAFEVESTYQPGGAPPPAHLHPAHDEEFEVLDGELQLEVDGMSRVLKTGATITVTRGQVHRVWNPSTTPTRMRWLSTPACRADGWFTGLSALVADAQRNGGKLDRLAFAAHAQRHRDTFRLAPGGRPQVGMVVTAGLATVARLTGHARLP